MFRLFLAVRYMVSRPVSYLAVAAIGVAVMALITVWSIMNGFLGETRAMIRGTTADIVVTPRESQRSPWSRERLETLIVGVDGVEAVCSRFVRPAVFKVHGTVWNRMNSSLMATSNQLIVLGIEPEDELEVTKLRAYLDDVDDPALAVADAEAPFAFERSRILDRRLRNAGLGRVILGEDIMVNHDLRPGMALELVTATDGDPFATEPQIAASSQTFIVAGAFNTGHYDTDVRQVFIERAAFKAWSGVTQEASEVYVRVSADIGQTDAAGLDQVRDQISITLAEDGIPAVTQTWLDRHRIFLNAVENERNILAIVLGFFVLLTCTITFSMLTMMVQEKVRDIGILAAMGASPWGITAVFGACSGMVAGFGGLLGMAAGTTLVIYINQVKDGIESLFGIQIFRKDVYAFTDIPAELDLMLNAKVAIVTVIFSIVICSWPALRAGRMDPVDALRHE